MRQLRELVSRTTSRHYPLDQDLLRYVEQVAASPQHPLLVIDLAHRRFDLAPVDLSRTVELRAPLSSVERQVRQLSLEDRFTEVVLRAGRKLPGSVGDEFAALMTPQALAMIVGTLALLAGAHALGGVPGLVIDALLISVGLVMVGMQIFTAAKLIGQAIAGTMGASSDAELEAAATNLSRAIAIIGVTTFLTLLTKAAAKRGLRRAPPGKEIPPEPPPKAPPKPEPKKAPTAATEPTRTPTMKEMMESKLRPMSQAEIDELRPRWQEIDAKSANLKAKGVDFSNNPELNQVRMGNSGTVTGREGTGDLAAANWERANAKVAEWAASGEDLSIGKINELNAMLGEGLSHNGGVPGQLRVAGQDVAAGSFSRMYLPGENVNASMGEYMSFYNANKATMGPVQLSGESCQRLISIHPYLDGNGRTTRLVGDWILQRNGLPPSAITGAEKNVAVFGLAESGATPTSAVTSMTSGVERSLGILGGH
jgi:hypothetical protein